MSCCFMFYPFTPMDTSKSDVQSSVAEYLEKEKLCQEICETITKSVEGPQLQGNCALPIEASSLLPEFNSDEDVEDILQQISDLLGSQLGDTSQCTDIEGVEDLSVDEILKQAEQIVRASTPYFERKTYKNCSGVEPLLEPIRRSVKLLAKRTTKPVPRHQPNLNESSHHDVYKNNRTEVSGSQLDVKNEFFDRNGNSPTPTNDSEDEVFESPVESPGPESPLHNELSNLRKSCSDSECHFKLTHELKKSYSAGTCDIKNMCGESLQRLTEEPDANNDKAELRERPKELTLSDLRVSPHFCSKETISEAISPEKTHANRNSVVEASNGANENINVNSVIGGNDDHNSCQINNEAITVSIVESAQREPQGNQEGSTAPNESVPVEVSRESKKMEVAKNTGRVDQKRTNRKADEKNSQPLAFAKHQALQNAKLMNTPKKSTSVNAKFSSKTVREDAENLCPNEDHCSIITDLRNQIQSLSNKVSDYEKFEARARKNETLAVAERQRIKLLQDEVKSQEELIVGYQRENQRLSNDILSAKDRFSKILEKEGSRHLSQMNG